MIHITYLLFFKDKVFQIISANYIYLGITSDSMLSYFLSPESKKSSLRKKTEKIGDGISSPVIKVKSGKKKTR